MENRGVDVKLSDSGEQEALDRWLQLRMLEDALDNNGHPAW